ncbi:MAG: chemotaxis protein CheR [bacterium]|nr:MAG: chemotaxis protein CheR [bacterium]
MTDRECTKFLQWCLPQLRMRWGGFRKVRRQVCKRIGRRIGELELTGAAAYRAYLEDHPGEWRRLDSLCRVTISRFYRDRAVFDALRTTVLPEIARTALERGEREVLFWSAGCASGEEAYTLNIIWKCDTETGALNAPQLRILATDSDPHLLERTERGCYTEGSLRELPDDLKRRAFTKTDEGYVIRDEYRKGMEYIEQDIRRNLPAGPFHLVMCRNLVWTYFEESLQRELLYRITERLTPVGFLVTGSHETLPEKESITLRTRIPPCIYELR